MIDPQPTPERPHEADGRRGAKLSNTGLVLSILGLCFFPVALVGGVMGIVGLVRTKDVPGKPGWSPALAAVVLAGLSLPITGAVAAIAIPAFTKYIGRAKTQEAAANLKALYDGARSHYGSGTGGAGAGAEDRFPRSIPRTPAEPPCGKTARWPQDADPAWEKLGFSPSGPLRYAYEVESDPAARVLTFRAVGDLDCDGTRSMIELAAGIEDGAWTRAPGFYTERELE